VSDGLGFLVVSFVSRASSLLPSSFVEAIFLKYEAVLSMKALNLSAVFLNLFRMSFPSLLFDL